VSTSSQRSGWDYATGMAEQWSGSTDYSSTMSFLEQHDPFPAGFEVELTRAGSRLPGAIVGRLRLERWQVVLENGSEVEADLLDLTPRTPVMTAGHSRGLVVGAPQLVCVDSMEENMVPAMALRALEWVGAADRVGEADGRLPASVAGQRPQWSVGFRGRA